MATQFTSGLLLEGISLREGQEVGGLAMQCKCSIWKRNDKLLADAGCHQGGSVDGNVRTAAG